MNSGAQWGVTKKGTKEYLIPGLDTYADNILALGTKLESNIPPYLIANQLHLLFNALTTDCRRKYYDGTPKACRFCATGHDHVCHIFGDCKIIQQARSIFNTMTEIHLDNIQWESSFHLSLLATTDVVAGDQLLGVLAFNAQVWRTRTTTRDECWKADPDLPNTIAMKALGDWRSSKETPLGTRFGNSKTRTLAQSHEATAHVEQIISLLPAGTAIFFTDGSANPSPGPAGAGCFVSRSADPDGRTGRDFRFSTSLGHGSNNLGEVWAIGMALQAIQSGLLSLGVSTGPGAQNVIFTDSNWTRDAILGRSRVRED